MMLKAEHQLGYPLAVRLRAQEAVIDEDTGEWSPTSFRAYDALSLPPDKPSNALRSHTDLLANLS